jgi:hypothetical protein
MSQKKSSTPRKSAKAKPTRSELRQDAARNIAAIYSNPETPKAIRDAIFSGLGDLWNDVPTESLYVSESYVLALIEAAASGKGARND